MIIIALSTDRTICRDGSPARERMRLYAKKLGELDVIIFSTKAHGCAPIDEGVLRIHPTNSVNMLLSGVDAVRRARQLRRPHVVTTQGPFETGLVAWVISRVHRAPLHIQIHTDIASPAFQKRGFGNVLRMRLAAWVLPRAARIRVVLERVAHLLRTQGIFVPISVLPIFVDAEKYRALEHMPHPRFAISLLFAGRLEKEKRADWAIRALKMARDAGHDAGLTIAGSGREEAGLRRLVKRLNLTEHVEFVGWQENMMPLYQTANLVLVPSEYEGYGMVIVEALAAGIPVLATDVGVARDAGAMVVAPDEFGAALVTWCQSGERKAVLKNHPYQNVEEYAAGFVADLEATLTEK